MQKEDNIEWISNLRVLATVAVIVVHVSMESRYGNALYADLFYGGFARFCVPVFVMISGALLLPRKVPLATFLKKWPVKILLPLVFWSIPYIIYNFRERLHQGETFTLLQGLKEVYTYIVEGTTNFHFWYIYMIVGIYLLVPIIGGWIRNATQKEILYFFDDLVYCFMVTTSGFSFSENRVRLLLFFRIPWLPGAGVLPVES